MGLISNTPVTGLAASTPTGATFISGAVPAVPPAVPAVGRHVVNNGTAYDGVPNDIFAQVTNTGRSLLARTLVEGLAFRLTGFAVGTGGYDVNDPTVASGVNPASTTLLSQVFPTSGVEALDLIEFPSNGSISALCRLGTTEALAGLGELGVWAEITSSPLVPSEVGDTHLFAVSHFPMQAKTNNHVFINRLAITF